MPNKPEELAPIPYYSNAAKCWIVLWDGKPMQPGVKYENYGSKNEALGAIAARNGRE